MNRVAELSYLGDVVTILRDGQDIKFTPPFRLENGNRNDWDGKTAYLREFSK
jgi:hypothetical protein